MTYKHQSKHLFPLEQRDQRVECTAAVHTLTMLWFVKYIKRSWDLYMLFEFNDMSSNKMKSWILFPYPSWRDFSLFSKQKIILDRFSNNCIFTDFILTTFMPTVLLREMQTALTEVPQEKHPERPGLCRRVLQIPFYTNKIPSNPFCTQVTCCYLCAVHRCLWAAPQKKTIKISTKWKHTVPLNHQRLHQYASRFFNLSNSLSPGLPHGSRLLSPSCPLSLPDSAPLHVSLPANFHLDPVLFCSCADYIKWNSFC